MTPEQILIKITERIEDQNYEGYDPFDGLNSKIIPKIFLSNKWIRIAVVQFFKLSAINLRAMAKVPKGINAKGLGLMLSVYAKLEERKKAEKILHLLREIRLNSDLKSGWGYYFDWQNRVFYAPRNTPTSVNTAFVVKGLIDCYERFGNPSFLDEAQSSIPFYLKHINFTSYGADKHCISYTPIDQSSVHNANLLTAAALYKLSKHSGKEQDQTLQTIAKKCLNYSLNAQRQDGSWRYGAATSQGFNDSFHTVFNLISLLEITQCLEFEDMETSKVCELTFTRGLNFYMENFVRNDGFCAYYPGDFSWSDIHCPAAALWLFGKLNSNDYNVIGSQVFQWTIKNFYKSGYFKYRINKFFSNNIEYQRWSNIWMAYALSHYFKSLK